MKAKICVLHLHDVDVKYLSTILCTIVVAQSLQDTAVQEYIIINCNMAFHILRRPTSKDK